MSHNANETRVDDAMRSLGYVWAGGWRNARGDRDQHAEQIAAAMRDLARWVDLARAGDFDHGYATGYAEGHNAGRREAEAGRTKAMVS